MQAFKDSVDSKLLNPDTSADNWAPRKVQSLRTKRIGLVFLKPSSKGSHATICDNTMKISYSNLSIFCRFPFDAGNC